MCNTSNDEVNLYKFKHKRYNPHLKMTLAFLLEKKGINLLQQKQMEIKDVMAMLD